MNRYQWTGLFALLLPAVATAAVPQPARKSLVICLDGMRADGLADADAPRLHALMDGHWRPGYRCASTYMAQNIKDAPTVSGPNHTTIYTGVTAALHHVVKNDDRQMAAVRYPDYFALLKRANPKLATARLATWMSDAQVPSGADDVDAGPAKMEVNAKDALMVDRAIGMIAGTYGDDRWAKGRDVDALLLFLDNPDHAGHTSGFGPSNPKYLAALHVLDAQVAEVLDAVVARPTFANEDWQVLITTDHGGYHTNHGGTEAECYGIPLVICSREAAQGTLAGVPSLVDVVPTILTHMGVSPAQTFQTTDGQPYHLPGHPRGDAVRPPEQPLKRTDGLLAHVSFDGNLTDDSAAATLKPAARGVPTFVDGKFGKAIHLTPEGGHVTLAPAGALPIGRGDCTIAFWYRATGEQARDPVILGNKDWASRDNPGLLFTASVGQGKSDVGLNLASAATGRHDVYRIDVTPGQWWLIAGVIRHDGCATLYAGGPDGRLQFISNDATRLGDFTGPLPLNLGQDGTGRYAAGLAADVDDLSIWSRALSLADIRQMYDGGRGSPIVGR